MCNTVNLWNLAPKNGVTKSYQTFVVVVVNNYIIFIRFIQMF